MLWWLCSSFLTSDALIQAPAICTCLEGKCWPSIPRRDTNRAHFNVNNPPWRGSMINVSFSCHGLIPNLGDTAFHCKLLSQDLDPVLPCKPCIFSYRNLNFSFSDLSTPLLQRCQPPDTLVCSFQQAAGDDSMPSSSTEVLHCPAADPAVVPARPPAKHWELSNTQRLPPARKQRSQLPPGDSHSMAGESRSKEQQQQPPLSPSAACTPPPPAQIRSGD